jgi:hypothetical protein
MVPIPVAARSKAKSATACLLGSRVRITLGAWMFVSRVYMLCCPVWVQASAMGCTLVQRSPTVCLIVCVITETPKGAPCFSWEPKGKWMNEWCSDGGQCGYSKQQNTYCDGKVGGLQARVQNKDNTSPFWKWDDSCPGWTSVSVGIKNM